MVGVGGWCRWLVSVVGAGGWCRWLVSVVGVGGWCWWLVSVVGDGDGDGDGFDDGVFIYTVEVSKYLQLELGKHPNFVVRTHKTSIEEVSF